MASPIIGRAECPECGFGAAHIKQSEKCVYRYCPECGSQYHAKTERQRSLLVAKMRPEGAPTPTRTDPTPTGPVEGATATDPVAEPESTPTPKRRGLFS